MMSKAPRSCQGKSCTHSGSSTASLLFHHHPWVCRAVLETGDGKPWTQRRVTLERQQLSDQHPGEDEGDTLLLKKGMERFLQMSGGAEMLLFIVRNATVALRGCAHHTTPPGAGEPPRAKAQHPIWRHLRQHPPQSPAGSSPAQPSLPRVSPEPGMKHHY